MKVFAGWLYGLQVFLVVPWFLGAIYRGEQSLWVWKEYAREVIQHGRGDAAFAVYLYAASTRPLFYFRISLWVYDTLRKPLARANTFAKDAFY